MITIKCTLKCEICGKAAEGSMNTKNPSGTSFFGVLGGPHYDVMAPDGWKWVGTFFADNLVCSKACETEYSKREQEARR